MTRDLLNITIAFQTGERYLHSEEKIILDFLKRGFCFDFPLCVT